MDVATAGVEAIGAITWSDPEDGELFVTMVVDATEFIVGQRWCGVLVDLYVGVAVPGVVAVFLARIEPSEQGVDEWLWLVVGDVPAAYLVTDETSTSVDAGSRPTSSS